MGAIDLQLPSKQHFNFNMLPPKYAKSVKITAHEKPVKVTATYDGVKEGQEDTKVDINLAAGESHIFEEKSENMGSWTAFRKIKHLRLEDDEGAHEHTVEDDCQLKPTTRCLQGSSCIDSLPNPG